MQGFPDGFVWGAATAAYQIEGGHDADGKGPSIWDTFSHTPGKISGNENGDVACDHYHRWRDDVALMGELGLGAYRFSTSWPRVLPGGTGAPNLKGLDFYSRLVDALLARGIRPFITLYHWDLPQALEDRGGWVARETAAAFGEYAALMGRTLGDRVKDWITLNEPFASTLIGYIWGMHPPGKRDPKLCYQASHHLNLAHGAAVQALRATVPGSRVGVTHVSMPIDPESDTEADRRAAVLHDGYMNRWYWEPTITGAYPADVLAHMGPIAPTIGPGDLTAIHQPIDFFGHNSYTRVVVRADRAALTGATPVPPKGPVTEMGWEVHPEHLFVALTRITRDYGAPDIYITENGAAFADELVGDRVDDPRRVDYLRTHLDAAHRAIAAGVKLRGYFYWSLMDNFEWSFGYSKRFGLIYVDYPTQRRIVKASGRFFADVARANALP
jgi:beta-glucosidase